MAGENDFFLKFGSNAENFADEVERSVLAAEASMGRLSAAVRDLNRDLRDSPLRSITGTIQDEMRGIARTVSATLATELQRSLAKEMPRIAQNLRLEVRADVQPTSQATATPEDTRQQAVGDRARRRASEQAAAETREEAQRISEAARFMQAVLRQATGEIDYGLDELEAVLRMNRTSLQAELLRQTSTVRQVGVTMERLDAALKSGQIASREAQAQRTQLQAQARAAQTELLQLTNRLLHETPPVRPGAGGEERVQIDQATLAMMTQASKIQLQAANQMRDAVASFDGALDALRAALTNLPEQMAQAQRDIPEEVVRQRAQAEAEATRAVGPDPSVDRLITDVRQNVVLLNEAIAQAARTKGATGQNVELASLFDDPAIRRMFTEGPEEHRGAYASAVNRLQSGASVDDVVANLEREIAKSAARRSVVEQRDEADMGAAAAARAAAQEDERDAAATREVIAAKNMETEARLEAVRVMEQATARARSFAQQFIRGGALVEDVPGDDLNVASQEAARRAGIRPTTQTLRQLGQEQGLIGAELERFATMTVRDVQQARETLRAAGTTMSRGVDIPLLQRQAQFGTYEVTPRMRATREGVVSDEQLGFRGTRRDVSIAGFAISPPPSRPRQTVLQPPEGLSPEDYRRITEQVGPAQRTLQLAELREHLLGTQTAFQTLLQEPMATVEAFITDSKDPFERNVMRSARESVEHIDVELMRRYGDIDPSELTERQQALLQGAEAREAIRRADQAALEARVDITKGELGRLAGQDARIATGGLGAAARLAEGPQGGRFFLREEGLTPAQMDDTFARLGGATKENVALVEQYNAIVRELIAATREQLTRGEAMRVEKELDVLEKRGELPPDAEQQRASIARIKARTELADESVEVLRDALFKVSPDVETARRMEQQSLYERVRGARPEVMPVESIESDRLAREVAAHQRVREGLAREVGVDLAAVSEDLSGRARIEAQEAAIQEAGVSARQLQDAYMATSRKLQESFAIEDRKNQAVDKYSRTLERLTAQVQRSRAPADPAGTFRAALAGDPRFAQASSTIERTSDIDRTALRRLAGGTESALDIESAIRALGGIDAVVEATGQLTGTIRPQHGEVPPPHLLREVGTPLGPERGVERELSRRLAESAERAHIRTGRLFETLTADTQREIIRSMARPDKAEGLIRDAERRVESDVARRAAYEQAPAERERLLRGAAGVDLEARQELVGYLRQAAGSRLSQMEGAERERAAAIRSALLEAGVDPRRFEGLGVEEIAARLDRNTQAVEENTQATRRASRVEDDMVTVYRGMAEPFDPTRAEPQRFATSREYALRNTNLGEHPFLYEMRIPRSQLLAESSLAEFAGGEGVRGAIISPEEMAAQARLVQAPEGFETLEAAVEENTRAQRENTQASRAEAERPGGIRPTSQMLDAEGAAALTGQFGPPTIPIPATDQERLALAERLDRLYQSGQFGLERAQELQDVPYGDADDQLRRQISTVRNYLMELAGGINAFYNSLRRQGFSEVEARRLAQSQNVTAPLIQEARVGQAATLGALFREGDLEGAAARGREGQTNERLIQVLTGLENTMGRLIECCTAMKSVATGMGEGGLPERGIVRSTDQELRNRVVGELSESMKGAVQRATQAEAAGDVEGYRRGMREAAMELMADPNIGATLTPAQIRQIVSTFASEATGTEVTRPTQRMLDDDLLMAGRFRGASEGAFRAFQAGDIENAGRAVVKASGDVDQAMDLIVRGFSLTSTEAQQARVALEAYQQELEQTGRSAQQAAQAERSTRGRREETPEAAALREVRGRQYAPGIYDPNAPAAANALAAGRFQIEQGAEVASTLKNLQQIYPDLTVQNIRYIESKLREATALQQAEQASQEAAIAEQRRAAILELLPAQMRQQLQAGQIGAGEVTQYLDAQTLSQGSASASVRRGIAGLFEADGTALDKQAATAVDRYVQSMQTSMGQYRTPMQTFMARMLGGQGSVVENVVRTTGNFIGRYIGGAIVFGLAAKFQELTSVALEAEQTFIRITAALDATGKSAQNVRAALQDIAVETNTNIHDTYEVMAQLVGVFETTEEALQATRVIGQLELISQGALNAREGFRVLSAVVTAFSPQLIEERGMGQEEAITYVADLATRIQDLTGVNIEDTTEGLARLGEVANSLNIEMELMASAIGLTAKATGQTGTAASEQLGRMLAKLEEAQVQDLLVQMGITDQSTILARDFQQVLIDVFNNFNQLSERQQGSLARALGDPRQFATTSAFLRRGQEALDAYTRSLDSSGAAAERAEAILNTFRGQVGQVGKQIQTLVTNLIELGVLNIFGLLVQGANLFLTPLNSILQVINELKDNNWLARWVIDIGLAVAGFKLLTGLLSGAVADAARLAGIQGVDSIGGAVRFGGQALARRSQARQAATALPDRTLGAPSAAVSQVAAVQVAGQQRRIWSRVADPAKQASAQLGRSIRTTGTALRGALFGSLIGGLTTAGFVLALFSDAITRGTRELMDWTDNVSSRFGELAAAAESEKRRASPEEEVQSERQRRLAEARDMGVIDRLGESWRHLTASPGNFIGRVTGQPWAVAGAQQAIQGILPGDVQNQMDELTQGILAARDSGDVEKAREARLALLEEGQEIIDGLSTAGQRATAIEQLENQLRLADAVVDATTDAAHGIELAYNFSQSQIDELVSEFQFLQGLNAQQLRHSGQGIRLMMENSNIPQVGKSALRAAFAPGQGYLASLQAQGEALDLAYGEAIRELRSAETQDEINAANQSMQTIIGLRAQHDQALIQALTALPLQQAELAMRLGDYAGAESTLRRAATEARRLAAQEAPGSPEELELINSSLDAARQAAEASIAEQVAALEFANIQTRDPMAQLANSLEMARARLESAIAAGPGAFSPEDIRGFVSEIADLQQQIGDGQEEIASAMVALRLEQTRNPMERANLEYAEAMRQYRRAIDEGLGAAAIISAAREAEAAARAVREQREELRAATAALSIARLPQGDTVAVAMAELAEAYNAQAFVIREYGRESVEYARSVQEIIDQQRGIEEAINEVADAHTAVALAFARAAGLDIEASRIELESARRALDRALDQSGGNENTAAVREAMAAVIDREAAVRDVVLNEATGTIDFLLQMEDITERQAVAALNEILATMDLTEQQRRDLQLKIKQLEDSINQEFSGQWNLGEIRIPTPFEVRRAIGLARITDGIEEVQDAISDELDSYRDHLNPETGGLDEILGEDLANEVRGVGGGIDSLLPPLSEIPTLVDETIATRDAVIARLEQQAEGIISLREAQNASIGVLGETIQPPLGLIAEQQTMMTEMMDVSTGLIATGNEYLASSDGHLAFISENIAGLRESLGAFLITGGRSQRSLDAEARRYQGQADSGYADTFRRPPTANARNRGRDGRPLYERERERNPWDPRSHNRGGASHRQAALPAQQVLIQISGTDTQQVKKVITDVLGPSAFQTLTPGSSGARRM